jgi:hypothetical protein
MTKGMKITTTGVQALIFDTSIGGFLDIANIIPEKSETTDVGGGS